MKYFILLILFALQANSFANMSYEQEESYIKKVAKEIRRSLWIGGYEDVSSSEEKVTKSLLDEYVKHSNNSNYDSPLDGDEISQLYRCLHKKDCSLHLISVSSSFHSGYGIENHFILLDIKKEKHESIGHLVYAE